MTGARFERFSELLPEIDELNAPFWRGLAAGEVRLQRCGRCSAHQYPPESFCYQCGAQALSWVRVSGEGTVYSFIVVHQAYHEAFRAYLPYTVAIVQMDEGPRMLCPMLGLRQSVAIGDRVRPCIRPVGEARAFLTYVPAAEQGDRA
jgi:uncharacterized OB-fold protein